MVHSVLSYVEWSLLPFRVLAFSFESFAIDPSYSSRLKYRSFPRFILALALIKSLLLTRKERHAMLTLHLPHFPSLFPPSSPHHITPHPSPMQPRTASLPLLRAPQHWQLQQCAPLRGNSDTPSVFVRPAVSLSLYPYGHALDPHYDALPVMSGSSDTSCRDIRPPSYSLARHYSALYTFAMVGHNASAVRQRQTDFQAHRELSPTIMMVTMCRAASRQKEKERKRKRKRARIKTTKRPLIVKPLPCTVVAALNLRDCRRSQSPTYFPPSRCTGRAMQSRRPPLCLERMAKSAV